MSSESFAEQGRRALESGNLDEAVALLAQAVIENEGDVESRVLLARAYDRKQLYGNAARAFQGAVALRPQDPDLRYELGLALERSGDVQGAVAVYQQTLQLAPGHRAQARLHDLSPVGGQGSLPTATQMSTPPQAPSPSFGPAPAQAATFPPAGAPPFNPQGYGAAPGTSSPYPPAQQPPYPPAQQPPYAGAQQPPPPGTAAFYPPPPVIKKTPWWVYAIIVGVCLLLMMAIPVAILVPVFATARERAQLASCENNLKQLSVAALAYSQDYDEKLPPAQQWTDATYPYVKSEAVLVCPKGTPPASYAWNSTLNGEGLRDVDDPMSQPMIFESTTSSRNATDPLTSFTTRHASHGEESGSVAFMDGHVRALPEAPAAVPPLARAGG